MEVGLGPGDIVLDGDPAPPHKGHSAQFSARLLWPNGWMIKMPLGTEEGLGPGHIALVPMERGTSTTPLFGPCLLWSTVAHLLNCRALVHTYFRLLTLSQKKTNCYPIYT